MIDFKGKIIVIAGPTASGKSDIALRLAKETNGYIINGDSRQLYTKLNIGTAKPVFDKEISEGIHTIDNVKHFLYDCIDPKVNFTLFEYQNRVKEILNKEEGTPILVGGTGLYIDSVVFNYNLISNTKDSIDLSMKSIDELQEIAKPYLEEMSLSDRGNRHRLIRGIERGGINRDKGEELNHIYFVIDIEKEILRERVVKRVSDMFDNGLLEENLSLLKDGYTYSDKGMNSIGYKEFKEYFDNKISLDEVKESIIKNTMSYIKRQKTWFRRNKGSIWTNSYEEILYKASNFILKE